MKGAAAFYDSFAPDTLQGRTILQIIPKLDAGGAERTVLDIAAALAQAGARALVACERGRLVSELQAIGGVWIPFPAASKNPLQMSLNSRRLAMILRAESVDIIHAHSRAPAWVALAALRKVRIPFVTSYHANYGGTSALKLRYNAIMARGDVVVAHSHYTAEIIAKNYPSAMPRVQVIECGTDFSQFRAQNVSSARVRQLRESWGVASHERIILLPGRLTSIKGQKILIEAAHLLQEKGLEDARFILAGDEQGRTGYASELDALIAKYKLGGIVKRVGNCADMPAAYLAAAVICVPSLVPEGFGRVAVEAQGVGTPVIASDLGAVAETVLVPPRVEARERTGWQVPAGDAPALAHAVAEVIAMGASAREALAERARAHVEANFSIERMNGAMLHVYNQLLSGEIALQKPSLMRMSASGYS